jgi:caffeoyl-CoA O-methyltransferase
LDLVNQEIQAYAERYSSPEDDLTREVGEYTRQHHTEHHMLTGHLQGKLLEMISCMIQPSRILEIGTFTGYSALCLAKGLAPGGELHTIELREADAAIAKGYFLRSVYAKNIISHTGNALDIIPALNETWDLVFIDADKPAYIEYFNLVLPCVRKNGFILADNIFFHGQVLEEEVKNKSAKGIRDFNEFMKDREDVDKAIVTIRDGLFLIRKR